MIENQVAKAHFVDQDQYIQLSSGTASMGHTGPWVSCFVTQIFGYQLPLSIVSCLMTQIFRYQLPLPIVSTVFGLIIDRLIAVPMTVVQY